MYAVCRNSRLVSNCGSKFTNLSFTQRCQSSKYMYGRTLNSYSIHRPLSSSSLSTTLLCENNSTNTSLLKVNKSVLPSTNQLHWNRHVSTTSIMNSEPSSNVEKTVTALKEKSKDDHSVATSEPKKTIKQKIISELVHYYHGFRLLFIDIKVSSKLLSRVLKGHQLSRREHNLLVRTVSDMFRLVPFSVFIIVPFMELLLPVFIKLFPNMLPSTFQTAKDQDKKMKQSLKVKLEMAKFLQETLDNMTVKGKGHSSLAAKQFSEFCQKVRSEGGLCTSEEIMKFSKLFEDEITLDSLPRPQLVALCKVIEIKPIGTSNLLRFQLRMKLRSLAADDAMIQKEGIDSLSLSELQQACRSRGMRALGLSKDRLKFQLTQWLDLSINKHVPPSLLLLSRAMMLPETIPTSDKLKATISALPETVAVSTKAAIGEREGKVDNKTKIEIIKEEERKIQEERQELELSNDKEVLVDKAPIITDRAVDLEPKKSLKSTVETVKTEEENVTSEDMKTLQEAVEVLAAEKKSMQVEKEELEELKEEMTEYKEDVEDLEEVQTSEKTSEIKESKAAQRLFKKVNNMIQKLDHVVNTLEKKEHDIKKHIDEESKKENEELMRIDELMSVIRKIQKIPNEGKLEKIAEVLAKIDEDNDGSIRIDTVLKVMEEIDEGNVKLTSNQFSELVDLLEKEEALEGEEKKMANSTASKNDLSGIDSKMKKISK